MSVAEAPTAEMPRRTRAGALGDPAGRAAAAAGVLWLAGLAVAIDGAGDARVPLALTGAGTVLALFVLVPRAMRAARRHSTLLAVLVVGCLGLLALAVLGAVAGVGASLLLVPIRLLPFAALLAAAAGGLVLLADDLRGRFGIGDRIRTPWQRLSGPADRGAARPWRAAAGLALVGLAAVIGLALIYTYAGAGPLQVLLPLLVGGGALAVAGVPLAIAAMARADRARATAAVEDERLHVAAHLHDSVLQTLALVQRQAHDPAAVARLARRQEADLRAWMAGEAEYGESTLAGALRDVIAEVEDEQGVTVEATILGDRPLDREGEALASALREALRNAARHARGAPAFVFAQLGPACAEAFVRDEGTGFDLAAVPTERRGVRDAIVGRMAAAGGRATVESAPGEGTEVTLRIGKLS